MTTNNLKYFISEVSSARIFIKTYVQVEMKHSRIKKTQSLIAVPLTQAPATQQPFPPTAAPTTATTEPCKFKELFKVLLLVLININSIN